MSHTPGPWRSDEAYPACWEFGPGYGTPARAKAAFDVRAEGERTTVCGGVQGVRSRAEMQANARLIAAAPDLLAALEAFVGSEAGLRGISSGRFGMPTALMEQGYAAISKARCDEPRSKHPKEEG